MSDFGSYTYPKARKEYRCEECWTPILKGEKYCKIVGNYDGDFYSYKEHMDCNECVSALYTEYRCWDDEMPCLHELEVDDLDWVREKYPTVYEKIKKKNDKNP